MIGKKQKTKIPHARSDLKNIPHSNDINTIKKYTKPLYAAVGPETSIWPLKHSSESRLNCDCGRFKKAAIKIINMNLATKVTPIRTIINSRLQGPKRAIQITQRQLKMTKASKQFVNTVESRLKVENSLFLQCSLAKGN